MLSDSQCLRHLRHLQHGSDAGTNLRLNWIPPKHTHRACRRFGQAKKQFDRRSLARAVRSQERDEFAGSYPEIHLPQRLYFAEVLAGSVQTRDHRSAVTSFLRFL